MHTTARVLVVLVLFGLTASARAAGVVGDGTPGSCTTAALTAALSGGGLVTFDCGALEASVYPPADYEVTASTTIDGGGRIALLGAGNRLFRVPDSSAPGPALTLRDLRISHGRCPAGGPPGVAGLGGALWVGAGAVVTLADVLATDNRCDLPGSEQGGGLVHVNVGGTLLLQRVRAQGNGAVQGSVVHAVGADVTVEDSQFFANLTAVRGGNVFAQGGRVVLRRSSLWWGSASEAGGVVHASFLPGEPGLTVEGSVLTGYAPTGQGGAIFQDGGALLISGTTLLDNRARTGAGLYARDVSPLAVLNSTVARNQVGEPTAVDPNARGAAFYLAGATSGSISHTTIAYNQAWGTAGAFAGDAQAAVVLRASILEGNATITGNFFAPSCTLALGDGGFNLQSPGPPEDVDCVAGILRAPTGLFSFEYHGLVAPTYDLAASSPARDRVTSGCPPPSTDQRGVPRPQGPACDSGAVERVPLVSVDDVSVYEGNSGSVPAAFTVSLSYASADEVTVAYETVDIGGASSGVDFVAVAGTLTFPPGTTQRTVNVAVLGDATPEPYELFRLRLDAPTAAMITDAEGSGTIQDDDHPSLILLHGCGVVEGSPVAACRFKVDLLTLNGAPVTVEYTTTGVTASAGSDFLAVAGTVTFAPGQLEQFVSVPVLDDALDEIDETFSIDLSNPQNGTIALGQAEGRLDDDDGPIVSVSDVEVVEGNDGHQQGFATVSLSAPSPQDVLVDHMPVEGTATSMVDYIPPFGTLVFSPGETTKTVPVLIIGDVIDEPDERFGLRLRNPVDATVAASDATVTIVDDDGGIIRVGELFHGSSIRTDLAGGSDLFLLQRPAYTSWEVVVDEVSGDLGEGDGPKVDWLAHDLTTTLQSSVAVGTGSARSLRLLTGDPVPPSAENYVRVSSTSCGSDCGSDDVYRIRAYETTLRSPRFNCLPGQKTALVLQNAGDVPVTAWPKAWFSSGQEVSYGLWPFVTLPPRGVVPWDLCAFLNWRSGSLTLLHDGAYGQLVGKVVQIDTATGASYETPLTVRPR